MPKLLRASISDVEVVENKGATSRHAHKAAVLTAVVNPGT